MRPGRPRCPRRIENEPVVTYFKPRGVPLKDLDFVLLSFEELEVVRLVDLEGLDHEDAAKKVGISRRALWEDLQRARKKIIEALVNGKAIEIKGGDFILNKPKMCLCVGCRNEWEIPDSAKEPHQCPKCGRGDVQYVGDDHRGGGQKKCCEGRCRHDIEGH
jgi:uncharacterized protein